MHRSPPTRRVRVAATGALAATMAALAVGPPVALADPSCQQSGSDTVCTFSYTGGPQTWTVPAGATNASFDVYGAAGGAGRPGDAPGGLGGRATATIAVAPGDTLQVNVGGAGDERQVCDGYGTTDGGFNGGAGGTYCGGGGGGGSDVRTGAYALQDRIIVAGGGGGGGTSDGGTNAGGAGGSGGGITGGDGVTSASGGGGGRGGTTLGSGSGSGGSGGAGGGAYVYGIGGGNDGWFGHGGYGGFISSCCPSSGGGGGGGYYGGGGGGGGDFGSGGGGGGSGFGPTGVQFETGVRAGNGRVTITYRAAYAFDGFFQPIDTLDANGNPVLNVVKAGQAIPLKWRLTDATGGPVTNLASAQITVAGINCTAGSTQDQLEDTAVGASGLQNLGNGNYQLNWKSPTSYAGSCKRLRLDLDDGSSHTADFKFTK